MHRDARLQREIEALPIQCREMPDCPWRGSLGHDGKYYHAHCAEHHQVPRPVVNVVASPLIHIAQGREPAPYAHGAPPSVQRADWYEDGYRWFGSTDSESLELRCKYFYALSHTSGIWIRMGKAELDAFLVCFNHDLFDTTLHGRRFRTVSQSLVLLLHSTLRQYRIVTMDNLVATHQQLLAHQYTPEVEPIRNIPAEAPRMGNIPPTSKPCCVIM
jgi:hypothetical protein